MAKRTKTDGTLGSAWQRADPAVGGLPLDEQYLLGTEGEIKIALADFDCRVNTNYEARLLEVYLALEAEFVAQHRSELEQLKAFVQSHGG
jgi:hypothetical protein